MKIPLHRTAILSCVTPNDDPVMLAQGLRAALDQTARVVGVQAAAAHAAAR
jgi:hypothetical protein